MALFGLRVVHLWVVFRMEDVNRCGHVVATWGSQAQPVVWLSEEWSGRQVCYSCQRRVLVFPLGGLSGAPCLQVVPPHIQPVDILFSFARSCMSCAVSLPCVA